MQSIDKETIEIDFTASGVPDAAKNFRPYMFKDGENFLCILGTGDNAVTGTGATAELAMQDWAQRLEDQQRK
jgi:hypothetical protein